jgi:hypothetical protein
MIFFIFFKLFLKLAYQNNSKHIKKLIFNKNFFEKCTINSDLKNSTSTLIQLKLGEEPKNHLWIV